jgi:ribosomal protein S21
LYYLLHMIKIKVNGTPNLDRSLKLLKGKIIKTKQNEGLLSRLSFESKSQKRRKEILKAQFIQKKRDSEN